VFQMLERATRVGQNWTTCNFWSMEVKYWDSRLWLERQALWGETVPCVSRGMTASQGKRWQGRGWIAGGGGSAGLLKEGQLKVEAIVQLKDLG